MTYTAHAISTLDALPLNSITAFDGRLVMSAQPGNDFYTLDLTDYSATRVTLAFGPHTGTTVWRDAFVAKSVFTRANGGLFEYLLAYPDPPDPFARPPRFNFNGSTAFLALPADQIADIRSQNAAALASDNTTMWYFTASYLYEVTGSPTDVANIVVRRLARHGMERLTAAVYSAALDGIICYTSRGLMLYSPEDNSATLMNSSAPAGTVSLTLRNDRLVGVTRTQFVRFTGGVTPASITPPVGGAPDLDLAELQSLGLPAGAQTFWEPAHPDRYVSAARGQTFAGRGRNIIGICWHTPEEPSDFRNTTPAFFQTAPEPGRRASTQYFVAANGDIYQMVRDRDFALGQGGGNRRTDRLPRPEWWNAAEYGDYNNVFISIEVEGCSDDPGTYPTSPCAVAAPGGVDGGIGATMPIGGRQWASCVALAALLCRKYAIPVSREYAGVRHSELSTQRADPGPGFPMGSILRAVSERLDGVTLPGENLLYTPEYAPQTFRDTTSNVGVSETPPYYRTADVTGANAREAVPPSGYRQVPPPAAIPDATVPRFIPAPTTFAPPRYEGESAFVVGIPGWTDILPAAVFQSGVEKRLLKRRAEMIVNGETIVDDEYRVKFNIEYNQDAKQPARTIEFFNLNAQTEARMAAGASFEFRAGYEDGAFGTLAIGEILASWGEWKPPERIFKVLVGETAIGAGAQRIVTISGARKESYRVKIDQLVRAMGFTALTRDLERFPELDAEVFWSWAGDPTEGLNTITRNIRLNWTVNLGVVQFSRKPRPRPDLIALNATQTAAAAGAFVGPGTLSEHLFVGDPDEIARTSTPRNNEPVRELAVFQSYIDEVRGGVEVSPLVTVPYAIGPDTGMIGTPTLTDQGLEVKVRVTNAPLLDTEISVDGYGRFLLVGVKHAGDTYSGAYATTLTGIPL